MNTQLRAAKTAVEDPMPFTEDQQTTHLQREVDWYKSEYETLLHWHGLKCEIHRKLRRKVRALERVIVMLVEKQLL